jgi:hypothetical protein
MTLLNSQRLQMISKTSKEEDEDEASLWRKNDRRPRTSGGGSLEIVELLRRR